MADWRIDWQGLSITADDMTPGEAATVLSIVGEDSWAVLDNPARTPLTLMAFAAALAQHRGGMSFDDAVAYVAQAGTLGDLVAAVSVTRRDV